MKNLLDINGLQNGEKIIAVINDKNYSYVDLIKLFNEPIKEEDINDRNRLRYFVYINLFNDTSIEYKENKYLINSIFFMHLDEFFKNNSDIKNEYLNFKLNSTTDELMKSELKLAIEQKDYLIIDEDLLNIFDNLKSFLEKDIPEINNKYNNEIYQYNKENNDPENQTSQLKWIELSLSYFKLLHNLFILCIIAK